MKQETILLIVILILILLIILSLFIVSLIITSKVYNKRYENDPRITIFTYKDFPFLDHEDFSFISSGSEINGKIYSLKEKSKLNNKVIIFFHGIGGGHENYMHEIIEFINKGYYVFAYDYLGCEKSEGNEIKGLLEPLKEVENFYKYFKTLTKYKDMPIYLVGHSWGGFTSIASSNIIKDAKKVVALSAFNSASFPSKGNVLLIKLIRPYIFLINLFKFGKLSFYTSKKTIKRNKNIKYLLINGEKDKVCLPNQSSDIYLKLNYSNLTSVRLKNKGHSPQLTIEAEHYLGVFLKELKHKDFDNSKFDYDLLTLQDDKVYEMIFNFLEGEKNENK